MGKIGDAFSIIRNGASIKQTDGASGLPITRIETISDKTFNRAKMGYADIQDDGKYDDYILEDGDILMSHINSEKHLGKVALYKKHDNEKIIHGMNLLMLRPNEKMLSSYAYYYFSSKYFIQQIVPITKKSVNQASFTVTALKKLNIPIPKKSEQLNIAKSLSSIDELIELYNKQIEELETLKKSLMQQYFG